MEWEKTEKENFQKKKEKPIHLVQLMENQKEFEKIISECLTENSRLKKKRAYWSIQCITLESSKDVALSTKIKDIYDQIKCIRN